MRPTKCHVADSRSWSCAVLRAGDRCRGRRGSSAGRVRRVALRTCRARPSARRNVAVTRCWPSRMLRGCSSCRRRPSRAARRAAPAPAGRRGRDEQVPFGAPACGDTRDAGRCCVPLCSMVQRTQTCLDRLLKQGSCRTPIGHTGMQGAPNCATAPLQWRPARQRGKVRGLIGRNSSARQSN